MSERTERATTFDVRIWNLKMVPSTKADARRNEGAYRLRWVVAGRTHSATFATKALAESERSALLAAARRGEAFDLETGLPVSKLPPPAVIEHPWWEWAQAYMDLKWPHLAPNSLQSAAEALTTVTLALLASEEGRPPAAELRKALSVRVR